MKTLDGKKVIFIGNSFVYYGGCVEPGNQREEDNGIFARLCAAMGDKVSVTDCTYGGHHFCDFSAEGCKFSKCIGKPCYGSDLLRGLDLSSFDVVFFSESGDNFPHFLEDARTIMRRFPNPKTEFVYLCHTFTHYKKHNYVLDGMRELQKDGVVLADWGKVCYLLTEEVHRLVPGGEVYTAESFIKNKGDRHHPNPLGGYLTALCAYCAYTGRKAEGLPFDVCDGVRFGNDAIGFYEFTDRHYLHSDDTNFYRILESQKEMLALQVFADRVLFQ